MNGTHTVPPHMQDAEPHRFTSGRGSFWYAVAIAAIPLPLLVASFFIARTPWFLKHNAAPFMNVSGYSLRLKNVNCEVVIYGDSTALAGIDPLLIQAKTGLRSCNIAELRPVQNAVGVDFPLDSYLQQNAPPRYLVTAWHPPSLNLRHPRFYNAHADGVRYALAYDRGPWLSEALIMHPEVTLNFLTWVMRGVEQDTADRMAGRHERLWASDLGSDRISHAGMTPLEGPPAQNCGTGEEADAPKSASHMENAEQVQSFRRKYQTDSTRVIVDVTPIPDCARNLEDIRKEVQGVTDNLLETMPINYFVDPMHLHRSGADKFSKEIANQVLQMMRKESSMPPGTPASEAEAQ